MTEHTPGPWLVFNKNGVVAIKTKRGRSPKNEVIHWTGFDASHYPKHIVANARLIAAAPDMLAALIAVDQAVSRLQLTEEEAGAMALVDTALAKAAGSPEHGRDNELRPRVGSLRENPALPGTQRRKSRALIGASVSGR